MKRFVMASGAALMCLSALWQIGTTHANVHPTKVMVVKQTGSLHFLGSPMVTATSAMSAAVPFFVNRMTGYAALNGEVIKTSDAGKSWAIVGHVAGNIQSLAFTNAMNGFAAVQNIENTNPNQTYVKYTFSIYHTTDGGKSWVSVWTKKVTEPQYRGYMADNFHFSLYGLTGYAVLSGNLLKTINGGRTWQPVRVTGQVEDAVATDANHLWVVTSNASISKTQTTQGNIILYRSSDGGGHFTKVLQTAPMTLWEAKLAFDKHGNGLLLVKDLGSWATTAYYTTNGGQSWRHNQPSLYDGRVAQSSPVFGSGGIAYIAEDPGAAPLPGGMTAFQVKAGKASLANQNDWRSAQLGAVQGQTIYATASLNEGGMAIFQSGNLGKTWQQIYPAGVPNVQIHFLTANVGYGIGMDEASGYIYKTTDGGQHWLLLKKMNGVFPNAISFVNSRLSYVSAFVPRGANGYTLKLLVSHDGGSTWTLLKSAQIPANVLQALNLPYLATTLSASSEGFSLTVNNGYPTVVMASSKGENWTTVASLSNGIGIESEAYLGPNQLWLSSVTQNHIPTKSKPSVYTSTVYHLNGMMTKNGQLTPLFTLPKNWSIIGMDRLNQQDAYIYATKSLYESPTVALFVTHDAGKTWTEYVHTAPANSAQNPMPLNLYMSGAVINISFSSMNDGYMLTANGLLRTTDGGKDWEYVR